jgi:hypothetical protein
LKRKLKILVSGMIASHPWQGGATWAVLQYVLGFRQLGHEVYLVEPIESKAIQPAGSGLLESENAAYFKQVMTEFQLSQNSALLLTGTTQTFGLPYDALRALAGSVDLLLNISGMLTDEDLTAPIPIRVYLDLDPTFNQLWNAVQGLDMRFAGHTHFLTVGLAMGEPECEVPTCGLEWLKTLQPIVLEQWPTTKQITYDALTTVANWRGYGSIDHQGHHYGQKAHSLRRFLDLPTVTDQTFLLALAIHSGETKDLAALKAQRWQLIEPAEVAHCPASYRQFIQGSKAEFGIAKSGYVISRCAWFSDRSVCYLASGKPVIGQETGFSRHLPTGAGLFAFNTTDDVLAAIEELRSDYAKHARAARQVAEDHFDSRKVLTHLLQQVGA